jgi:hypothetical protein
MTPWLVAVAYYEFQILFCNAIRGNLTLDFKCSYASWHGDPVIAQYSVTLNY